MSSIWNYIRQRTRDAVLAGIQDAMDIVEQDDTNGEQHAKAGALASRLNPPKAITSDVKTDDDQAEEGPQDVAEAATGEAVDENGVPTSEPPPDAFGDELERRLEEAARDSHQPAAAKKRTPTPGPRRRSRPRKDETQ